MKYKHLFLLFMLLILKLVSSQKTLPIKGIKTVEGTSIPLDEDELERLERERTRNVVKLAATDQLNSEIITNRSRAYLSCESGEMIVKINFSVPFRGVAYANYDRESDCKFYGNGTKYYEMRIPLKGCGTKQEAPRLFINNIIFRFHRSLELEEDEIKTIICRYPPPLAPPPANPIAPYIEPVVPASAMALNKLSEIELLLIICALLFLTLLLLGIGIGYYCLKRRNIKIVRKKKLPTPAPSEITKLSQSTLFDQIKIPRATAHSTESSETIPSDYPSESISDDEVRPPIPYPMDVEKAESISAVPVPVMHKPEITKKDVCTTILSTEKVCEEDVVNTRNRKIIPQQQLVPYLPKLTTKTADDLYVDNEEDKEITEDTTQNKLTLIPGPKIMVKNIDDLYVTNISETVTTERTMKAREPEQSKNRQAIESKKMSTAVKSAVSSTQKQSNWDVSIRNYPVEPTREISENYSIEVDQTQMIDGTHIKSKSDFDAKSESVKHSKREEKLRESTRSADQKFDVIFKVLDNPPRVEEVSEITKEDKNRWQTVIATDDIFRSLITESTTIEEYTRISRDIRYESLFKPKTWEVIIRILTHPSVVKHTSVQTQTQSTHKSKYRNKKYAQASSHLKSAYSAAEAGQQILLSSSDQKRQVKQEDAKFNRSEAGLWSQAQRSERINYQSSKKVPFKPSRRQHYVERSANISEFVFPQNSGPIFQPSSSDHHSTQTQLISSTHQSHTSPYFQQGSFGYVRGASIYERAATSEVFMTGTGSRMHDRASTVGDREEIKSVTETDVYDHWLN